MDEIKWTRSPHSVVLLCCLQFFVNQQPAVVMRRGGGGGGGGGGGVRRALKHIFVLAKRWCNNFHVSLWHHCGQRYFFPFTYIGKEMSVNQSIFIFFGVKTWIALIQIIWVVYLPIHLMKPKTTSIKRTGYSIGGGATLIPMKLLIGAWSQNGLTLEELKYLSGIFHIHPNPTSRSLHHSSTKNDSGFSF